MTRRRRTRAALALEETRSEGEEGEKVVTGERSSHPAMQAGSRPRMELLASDILSLR